MTTSVREATQPSRPLAWALALVVVGVRLGLLDYAGSPLPFYDQWLAEYNNMLVPISGGAGFNTVFEWHNEHLPASMRLLTLAGFLFNGYWDVLFLSVCAAVIRAATAVWTFRLIAADSTRGSQVCLWLLCLVVFAAPLSAYNLLNGMQVSFYLTDLALLTSIHAMRTGIGASARIALLVGSTVFGLASMGSAITLPAATIAIQLIDRQPRPGFWPAWIVSAGLAIAYAATVAVAGAEFTPVVPPSVVDATTFAFALLAWPHLMPAVGIVLAMAVAAGLALLIRRERLAPYIAPIIGVGAYGVANALLIAARRDPSEFHPRHWDTIGLIPLAILALGIRLFPLSGSIVRVATVTGASAYLAKVTLLVITVSGPFLIQSRTDRDAVVAHYRKVLLTERDLREAGATMQANLVAHNHAFFDDPIGRHALHPVVVHNLLLFRPVTHTLLAPEILPARPRSALGSALRALCAWGWLIAGTGLILAIVTLRPRPCPPHGGT